MYELVRSGPARLPFLNMTEEKALSLFERALREEARVLAPKECAPDTQTDGVAGSVACDGGSEADEDEPADIEVTLSSEQPSCGEERVTWQEQPDEETAFGTRSLPHRGDQACG